ncbi:MAG TPA: thioredoxin-like domain-containing protein [Lacipirellulaceae bacterium]|nr:thioredoxin-like domain-containing protein [Lacipirellulaceae bacterium]
MDSKQILRFAAFFVLAGQASMNAVAAPTLEQALSFKPTQPLVEYTIPTPEEAAKCTFRPERENNISAWVVRNAQGDILRRFADTNNDNTVDMWCYYLDGLEVYRDIDSNFNKSADQYRWFHTAGTRWGIDKNEDKRIDAWQTISPHEVAEQVVLALKTRDAARFNLLLITPSELEQLGLGKTKEDALTSTVKAASGGFGKLADEQKIITSESRYVDFGSGRPALIPAGTNGSTKDVVVCDNASVLVQTGDKHEQMALGTLVAVGDTWKLVALPAIGGDSEAPRIGLLDPSTPAAQGDAAAGAPNAEMQKLMAELERLDRQADQLSPEKQAENIQQRTDLLLRLADATPDTELRNQWYRQLADMLSVAIQTSNDPKGVERLTDLQKRLVDAKADENLLAHVEFQRMWAKYVIDQADPNANAAQVQDQWLKDLEAFVGTYPKSSDSAEALLQLGMYQEFVGKTEDARKWYQQLVTNFPEAPAAGKANGALRRLNSVGAQIRVRGQDLQGKTLDLAAPPYRGKVVLIHYWATWSDRAQADMVLLKDFYAKKGGRDFEILGVCLDASQAEAKKFLDENRLPWKHLYEPGGIDGRLANEMGIMTLPLMVLVDRDGRVVSHNTQIPELEAAINRLQKPAAASRGAQLPR